MLSLFLLLFWVFGGSRDQLPGASSSLRSGAGLERVLDDVLDASCDVDEEDELVPVLDDNPVTARGAKISVLQKKSSLVWSTVAFDRWPTHRYIRVLRKVFQAIDLQACNRVFAPSRRDQDRERILVLPRLFALHRWPLPPLWGSWISAGSPSISSELKSVLLSTYIDAPESTTNSRSCGDFEVGDGVALASIGE